jgi:hypothetical protein
LRRGNLAEIRNIPERCKIKERRGNEYKSEDTLMGDEFEDDLLFLLHSSLLLISIYLLIYAAGLFSSDDGEKTIR